MPRVLLEDVAIRVKLTTDKPIYKKPHYLGPRERTFAREQVEKWVKLGIYEEAISLYGCNITLADKKDTDELCICINYKPINDIIERDGYPLPRMEDMIMFLTNATYLTFTDVKLGFHIFCIHPNDRHKLAFVTLDGHY